MWYSSLDLEEKRINVEFASEKHHYVFHNNRCLILIHAAIVVIAFIIFSMVLVALRVHCNKLTPDQIEGLSLFFLTGVYIYIETSSPRSNGDKAILTLKGANSKSVCLSFYYHMYGQTINALNIYNRGQRIWSMNGNQGNSWKKAEVQISGDFDVSFTIQPGLVFLLVIDRLIYVSFKFNYGARIRHNILVLLGFSVFVFAVVFNFYFKRVLLPAGFHRF